MNPVEPIRAVRVCDGSAARLTVVLVNHRTAGETCGVLDRVLAELAAARPRLVVVDNGSGPEEIERLSRWRGPLNLLLSPANVGFGAGVNRAVEWAREMFGRTAAGTERPEDPGWLLTLNPDLVPSCGALTRLVRWLDAGPPVGIVGGVRSGQGPRSYGEFPSLAETLLRVARRPGGPPTFPFEVDWVSGSLQLVRTELFRSLGGYDEGYYMQMEDVDLCWRAVRAGWTTVVDPKISFAHAGHLSYERSGRRLDLDFRSSKARFIARREGRGAGFLYGVLASLAWIRDRALAGVR